MASAWGTAWGAAWGNSWGAIGDVVAPTVGRVTQQGVPAGGPRPHRQRRRLGPAEGDAPRIDFSDTLPEREPVRLRKRPADPKPIDLPPIVLDPVDPLAAAIAEQQEQVDPAEAQRQRQLVVRNKIEADRAADAELVRQAIEAAEAAAGERAEARRKRNSAALLMILAHAA